MTILMLSQDDSLPLLQPLPEAVHVGKCMKSSFANWFLLYKGQRLNLSILQALYNDCSDVVKHSIRKTLTLRSVRNRDRMSVHNLLLISQDSNLKAVSQVASIVQTVIPETFCLHKGNSRGVLEHPVSICCALQSKLVIVDRAQPKLFCARMHYPFNVEKVAKGLRDPSSVIFLEGVAYVADSGHKQVRFVALFKAVFLEPKKMKADDLREAVEKRGIPCTTRTKKPMAEALQKWITSRQKAGRMQSDELTTLKLNEALMRPVSLAVGGNEVIFVGDTNSHCVYQIAIDNNGAFLHAQVLSAIAIADSLPYRISVMKNSLIVADASSKGGLWKINSQTHQQDPVLANGTSTLQCVHGVAVRGERVYFTDRQGCKVCKLESERCQSLLIVAEREVQMGPRATPHFHIQLESALNKSPS